MSTWTSGTDQQVECRLAAAEQCRRLHNRRVSDYLIRDPVSEWCFERTVYSQASAAAVSEPSRSSPVARPEICPPRAAECPRG